MHFTKVTMMLKISKVKIVSISVERIKKKIVMSSMIWNWWCDDNVDDIAHTNRF